MSRIRAVAITIKGDELLAMFRKKHGQEYFVFPGGGVDEGEDIKDAVVREMKEETSSDISVLKMIYHVFDDVYGEQYFYLCDFAGGEVKLAEDSVEQKINSDENFYRPAWIKLNELKNLELYPITIRNALVEDLKNNFQDCPREISIKSLP